MDQSAQQPFEATTSGGATSAIAFPMPPMHLVAFYSDENIANGLAPLPPAIPTGPVSSFGIACDHTEPLIQSLETQGIRRLYPQTYDRKVELKKINHSILTNFLDLLEILIRAPNNAEREKKIEEIRLLFINMHHLINEYRPHQAYETLKLMLDVQHKERLEIKDRFRQHYEAIQGSLRSCLSDVTGTYELPADLAEKLETFNEAMKESAEEPKSAEDKNGHAMIDEGDALMCEVVDAMNFE